MRIFITLYGINGPTYSDVNIDPSFLLFPEADLKIVSDGELISSQLGSLLSLFHFLLSLPELGQVESCNFFSFLNLLLVGLDLLLELIGKFSHALLVFVVFILLELQFLDTTLSLLE